MPQAERDIEARQCEALHQPRDVAEFGRLRAQEFAPRRHVVEQVADLHQRALRLGDRRDVARFAVLDTQLDAAVRTARARGDP